MAIVIPISTTFDAKGIDKATRDIAKAEGGWAKAGAATKAAFVPATAALTGLAAAGFVAVKAAEQPATAETALSQVMSQMGYSQNTAAAKQYAQELSRATAIDDKAILAAQTKLATFSEVAKSTDLMGRATKVAADLSAAGYGDMSTQAQGLGKALQDPIGGMALLVKQGALTKDEQKALADEFLATGDKAKIQGDILAILEKQVGGVAEATANDSDKMALAWSNLTESIGMELLPMFQSLTDWVIRGTGFFEKHSKVIVTVAGTVAALSAVIIALNIAMKAYETVTKAADLAAKLLDTDFIKQIATTVKATAAWVANTASLVANKAAQLAAAIASKAVAVATGVMTAAQWALNAALTANPIGLVVAAIALLIGAFVLAYKKSDAFRAIVDKTFSFLKGAVVGYINIYLAVFRKIWEWMQKVIDKAAELARKIKDAFTIRAPSWLSGGIFGGIFGRSATASSVPSVSTFGTRAVATVGGGGNTFNIYESQDPRRTAAQIQRALEGYSISQGRPRGSVLAVSW